MKRLFSLAVLINILALWGHNIQVGRVDELQVELLTQHNTELEVLSAVDNIVPVLQSCGIITDGEGWGSCVAIEPDLLLTAAHCLERDGLWVEFAGKRYEIVEQWTSDNHDVGFVRVVGTLPVVKLGPMPRILDEVYIVGTPRCVDFLNMITSGVVCKLDLQYADSNVNWTGNFVCDAMAWRGNSGGPVLNGQGQIVGIYVGLFADVDNFSVCVPVSHIREALERYINEAN